MTLAEWKGRGSSGYFIRNHLSRNPGFLKWIKTVVLMLNSVLVLHIKTTEYMVATDKVTS